MNNMEEQLWAYIDGICSPQEQQTISNLIATDNAWGQKYRELLQLNSEIAGMELDEPPMAFTYNVMEGIRADYARQPLKAHINMAVVKLIGGFFMLTLFVMLAFIAINVDWSAGGTGKVMFDLGNKLPDMSTTFSSPLFKCFMFINIVLGLYLFNGLLHIRNTTKHHN